MQLSQRIKIQQLEEEIKKWQFQSLCLRRQSGQNLYTKASKTPLEQARFFPMMSQNEAEQLIDLKTLVFWTCLETHFSLDWKTNSISPSHSSSQQNTTTCGLSFQQLRDCWPMWACTVSSWPSRVCGGIKYCCVWSLWGVSIRVWPLWDPCACLPMCGKHEISLHPLRTVDIVTQSDAPKQHKGTFQQRNLMLIQCFRHSKRISFWKQFLVESGPISL